MEQSINIKKKKADEVVCWKEDASQLTPNTVINLETGLVAVIKVDGKRKVQTQSVATVFGLFNIGKNKKLFGGKKAYKGENEICVIDKSSEFEAEWGFGEYNPIACRDLDFDAECEAIATGLYTYQISNYAEFLNAVPMKNDQITRGDIREFLRNESAGVISAYLSEQLLRNGMTECKANIAKISDELVKRINAKIESKGLAVISVIIESLDYTSRWKKAHNLLHGVKVEGVIKGKQNDIERDNISLGEAENKVILPRIKAIGDATRQQAPRENGKVVYCHSCGEQNVNSNYCKKCGAKLHQD